MFSPTQQARSPIGRRRREHQRGQDMVEFTLLITFFLVIFFCIIQVALTAVDKFHMNHYAAYAARVWSTCPCELPGPKSIQVNEALARAKLGEYAKKLATSRNMTEGDKWRIKYLWAVHSGDIPGGVSQFIIPFWATRNTSPAPTGPLFVQPIPMRMPYSSMAMGGSMALSFDQFVPSSVKSILAILGIPLPSLNIALPKVGGFKVVLAQTFVPMDKEPGENPDEYDNDGFKSRQLRWTDLVSF